MNDEELLDLVNAPNETLSAEYKRWLDLEASHEHRAKIAQHIAALSNFGGGVIVFGFEDDMSVSEQNLQPAKAYTTDLVSGICRKYLEPAPQCDTRQLVSSAGNKHTVIIVPPHAAVPVCAKANGPEVGKSIAGVVKGTYYIRKTGPASMPIQSPEDWAPVIRRCVMHDRGAILGALGAALQPPQQNASAADELKQLHEAARETYLTDVRKRNDPVWIKSFGQFSYAIARSDGQILDVADLPAIALELNSEVRDRVRSGWSMFYTFGGPAAPHFETDAASGKGEQEFLQARLLKNPDARHPDVWRLAPDGFATIIREFFEDDEEICKNRGFERATFVSPKRQFMYLGELVRHAQAFAERFDSPTTVTFRCEWRGLEGRAWGAPDENWSKGRISNSDTRVSSLTRPVAALSSQWHDIVAALGAPLVRAFATDLNITGDRVRSWAPEWLR